jgi:hypothetical protein
MGVPWSMFRYTHRSYSVGLYINIYMHNINNTRIYIYTILYYIVFFSNILYNVILHCISLSHIILYPINDAQYIPIKCHLTIWLFNSSPRCGNLNPQSKALVWFFGERGTIFALLIFLARWILNV